VPPALRAPRAGRSLEQRILLTRELCLLGSAALMVYTQASSGTTLLQGRERERLPDLFRPSTAPSAPVMAVPARTVAKCTRHQHAAVPAFVPRLSVHVPSHRCKRSTGPPLARHGTRYQFHPRD